MFDLNYVAANTGATWARKGDIFNTETLTADSNGKVTLAYAPVPVQTNGTAYLFYRSSTDSTGDYVKIQASGKEVTLPSEYKNATVCVMYRYSNNFADQIIISSQFIPETLHAVLTVALYAGDSCNIGESTNKIGEVTIDVPRFQLSGSEEISMTASGASQTSLEGNALASGCAGCDGKATYATITKVLFDQTEDKVVAAIIEDGSFTISKGSTKQLVTYVTFDGSAPHITDSVVYASTTAATATVDSDGVLTAVAAGTTNVTATVTLPSGATKTSEAITVTVTA